MAMTGIGKSYISDTFPNYADQAVVDDTALMSVQRMGSDAVELAERIISLVDRACGIAPQLNSPTEAKDKPSGVLPSLKSQAEYISSRIQTAQYSLSRLERELN
jgi:hypothetical protein